MLILDQKLLDGGLAEAAWGKRMSEDQVNCRADTYEVVGAVSGNVGSCFSTLANVATRLAPLNGVVAN